MSIPTPVPPDTAPHPRALRTIPFSVELGDRVERKQTDALARAFARAPKRGRQQVRRSRRNLTLGHWFIQDIR